MNKKVRIIKRYQNRKLYDTFNRRYIKLEEVWQIIRDGQDIKIIDNITQKDITYKIQIQILFNQERQVNGKEDIELLKKIIKTGEGTFTDYIKKRNIY